MPRRRVPWRDPEDPVPSSRNQRDELRIYTLRHCTMLRMQKDDGMTIGMRSTVKDDETDPGLVRIREQLQEQAETFRCAASGGHPRPVTSVDNPWASNHIEEVAIPITTMDGDDSITTLSEFMISSNKERRWRSGWSTIRRWMYAIVVCAVIGFLGGESK